MIASKQAGMGGTPHFPLPAAQERLVLWVLAAIQFTHIIDFMIVMPLGPRLMDIFRITPAQFGVIVTTYAVSAGLFGLVAAWFLDRLDRKVALLWLYGGFGLGTLACAFAPNYPFLVVARFFAGGFGGVASAVILALVADIIPPQRRGAAMGTLFTSFSIASIAGVPAGLFLANHFQWHAPFWMLAGLSLVILVAAAFVVPSMRHLVAAHGAGRSVLADMGAILARPNHWWAFSLTMVMTLAGFLLIPYIAPSLVANVGVPNEKIQWVYFWGGLATFFSMRWIGRLGDRKGLFKVFVPASLLTIIPLILVGNLPPVPLWQAVIATTMFMVFSSGRMVPGMAMVANSVEPRHRGGFMSINSAFQQFASGLGALIAGLIIVRAGDGRLLGLGTVGALGSACILLSIWLAKKLKPAAEARAPAAPATQSVPVEPPPA